MTVAEVIRQLKSLDQNENIAVAIPVDGDTNYYRPIDGVKFEANRPVLMVRDPRPGERV